MMMLSQGRCQNSLKMASNLIAIKSLFFVAFLENAIQIVYSL